MAYGTGGCVKEDIRKNEEKPSENQGLHHEDLALKTAAHYFGVELLPALGISGIVEYIAPTESVKLEARQMYQDFNYVMEDRSWSHLEFESDSVTDEDLRRFREYEAAVSRKFGVEVVTYVICSSKVKCLKAQLKVGINTYRVKIVRLKGRNADLLFRRLEEKGRRGERLERADFVSVLLTPLMSGESPIGERIIKGMKILQDAAGSLSAEEQEKMLAVLYTFADKFVSEKELNRVKEMIAMTKLGKLLVDDGIEKGIERGLEQGLEQGMKALTETCKEFGADFRQTVEKVKIRFGISEEEAQEAVRKYWQ